MRTLFHEATKLQNRYGLVPYNSMAMDESSNVISRSRTGIYQQALQDVINRVGKLNISIRWARWAIKDKSSFEELISHISYFVDKLHQLVPDCTDGSDSRAMMEADFSENLPATKLKMICNISGLRDSVVEVATQSLKKKCQTRILELFWHSDMHLRENSISPAHAATFKWALEPQSDNQEWDDLSAWLKSETGIYWVRGKAGSGKSTLMKFIWFHENTKMFVEEWAGGNPYLMANFYFWRIGSRNQNSLEGLFRDIIYQVLRYCPSATQMMFPDLWAKAFGHDKNEVTLRIPTFEELKTAPLRIGRLSQLEDTKVCVFIDGLDEFDGEYRSGIDFIKALTRQQGIKAVISSRPEPIIIDSLRNIPSMRLERLTRDDIAKYARDYLAQHTYIQSLIEMGSISEGEELISDIVDKANGVFLWVVLACRSLLDGFAAYDRLPELRQRINELPPQLEELFKFMLMKVDSRYRVQGARLLSICYRNNMIRKSLLPMVGMAMLDEHDMDPTRIRTCQRLTADQLSQKCQILEGRLRSRCGGLLEILVAQPGTEKSRDGYNKRILSFVNIAGSGRLNYLWCCAVGFMHRTVFEFLHDEHAWSIECLDLGGQSFSTEAAIASVFLHSAQVWAGLGCRFKNHLHEFLISASLISPAAESVSTALMRQLESFLTRLPNTSGLLSGDKEECLSTDMALRYAVEVDEATLLNGDKEACSATVIALRYAVEAGAVTFVSERLRQNPKLMHSRDSQTSLVYHAANRCIIRSYIEDGDGHWLIKRNTYLTAVLSPHKLNMTALLLDIGRSSNGNPLTSSKKPVSQGPLRDLLSTKPISELVDDAETLLELSVEALRILQQYLLIQKLYYENSISKIQNEDFISKKVIGLIQRNENPNDLPALERQQFHDTAQFITRLIREKEQAARFSSDCGLKKAKKRKRGRAKQESPNHGPPQPKRELIHDAECTLRDTSK